MGDQVVANRLDYCTGIFCRICCKLASAHGTPALGHKQILGKIQAPSKIPPSKRSVRTVSTCQLATNDSKLDGASLNDSKECGRPSPPLALRVAMVSSNGERNGVQLPPVTNLLLLVLHQALCPVLPERHFHLFDSR
jgi:hypothetical protein